MPYIGGNPGIRRSGGDTLTDLTKVGGESVTLGQKTKDESIPVTFASDQTLTVIAEGDFTAADNQAEDGPHTTGETGSFILGVRNDGDAVRTSADGDYSPISVDSVGRVKVAPGLDVGAAVGTATMQSAATANGNGTVLTTTRFNTASMYVSGAFSAAINFEGTRIVGGVFFPIFVTNTATGEQVTVTTASDKLFVVNVAGYQEIRARISGYASGSVTVAGMATAAKSNNGLASLAQNIFHRIKTKQFIDTDHVQYDVPTVLTSAFIYVGVAPYGTADATAAWNIVRTSFSASGTPTGDRFRSGVAWSARSSGW